MRLGTGQLTAKISVGGISSRYPARNEVHNLGTIDSIPLYRKATAFVKEELNALHLYSIQRRS
jgi:hypothetical protein